MATTVSLLRVFARHRLQAALAFTLVLGSCLATGLLTPVEYQSEAKLLFQDPGPEVSGLAGVADNGTYAHASDPIENLLELIKTGSVLQSAIEAAKPVNPKTHSVFSVDQLRAGLATKQILGTDIVVLSFKSGDPHSARQVVQAVADAFIRDMVASSRRRATAIRQFIQQKLPTVERNLKQAERDLQNFQNASGSVEIAVETQTAVNNLSTLETRQRELRAMFDSEQSQLDGLRQRLGGRTSAQAITRLAVSEDPDIQAMRAQLATLDADIARQSGRLGPQHPIMQSLQRQREALESLIDGRIRRLGGSSGEQSVKVDSVSQELTTTLAQLEVKHSGTGRELNNVTAAIGGYRQKLQVLPGRQVRYAQLTRKVQVNTNAFNLLANRLEEAKIAEAQGLANVQLVEPPSEPGAPVWPNFFVLAAAGTAAGIAAGVGSVALKEAFSRKVLSGPEVQQLLQIPVLASLPLIEARPSEALEAWNREAYRMLCMNLRFLGQLGNQAEPLIVVSSALPNEGKTNVSIRLARSMAHSRQRVLLIDADLVRPSVASLLKLEAGPGLAEWLYEQVGSGNPPPIESLIQPSASENLDVLTAGQLQLEDSASFLSPPALEALLAQLANRYDQIVVDTPPLGGYAHGYLFGARARGILLVVRPEHSEHEPLVRVKQVIERNRIKLLGLVLNGVNGRQELAYNYYQRKAVPEGTDILQLPSARH